MKLSTIAAASATLAAPAALAAPARRDPATTENHKHAAETRKVSVSGPTGPASVPQERQPAAECGFDTIVVERSVEPRSG
ncbi:hypothetical protein GTA08_BOTSDO11593 [Botryosphaeria dothidea]|uniref:Uncharacterized protein n=1 Tax=Botryosphaeria dothidea TaxID=55169 RepID=A0A8H4N6B5_9PEZI|nr:hypothetical protein GTA08_BOTSDO11593 [Botryosphaeria dothidea]